MSVETFSTRIKGHNLESFLVEARKLRVLFQEAAQAAWRRDIVRFAAARFDERHAYLSLECMPSYCTYDTIEYARKDLVRCYETGDRSMRGQELYKYGVKADIYPLEGQLLAVFHVDHPVLQELLVSQPWWDDVTYPWASWDPKPAEELPVPAGLSFEEWKKRELLWSAAMQVAEPAGYQVTVLHPEGHQHRAVDEQLAQHIPTLDERISLVIAGLDRSLPDVPLPPNPTREQWEASHREVLQQHLLPELTVSMLRKLD